jgi:hypothetical protein
VPWIVGTGRARWSKRQAVGGADVGDAIRREQRGESVEQSVGVLHVLDRLKEHDRVVGRLFVELLDQRASESEVPVAVLETRVLVRLRVCIDAQYLARVLGKDRGAVPLTASEVDDVHVVATFGNPTIDGHVTPVPVVLLGNVRQGALARQREWGHARRLVALHVRAAHGRGSGL